MKITHIALLSCAIAGAAHAQDYPNPSRTISIVIGYAPGGAVDVPSRWFADKLGKMTGAPVVVENRPGALTSIAASAVAKARPDGYTLFIASGNATMASNLHLFRKLPYDPVKDFTPVTMLYQVPFFMVVNVKNPVKTVAELTGQLKAKGGKGNYGYAGSFALIASELYKTLSGLETASISYKVPQQTIPALISGELDFIVQDATNVLRQVNAGTLKALAVTSGKRSALMPSVPTMEEAGLKDYELLGWFALFLPANPPAQVVERLNGWFSQMVRDDDTRKFLGSMGLEPFPGTAQAVSQLQAKEVERWGRLLKAAKIEAE